MANLSRSYGFGKFAAKRGEYQEMIARLERGELSLEEFKLYDDNVVPFKKPNGGDRSAALQPDRSEAERFLSLFDPAATYFTFQTFDDDIGRRKARKDEEAKINAERKAKGSKPIELKDPLACIIHGTLDECWNKLCRLNDQGAGIFFTVNETDRKGRSKKNITRVRALFNDLDGVPLEPVLKSKHPPHIVVESSPGHFHPYRLVSDVPRDQFKTLQKKVIAEFGGDAVHDLPRVMRLPGFFHRKDRTKPPTLVRIFSTQEAPRYTIKDFNDAGTDSSSKPNGEAESGYGKFYQQKFKQSEAHRLNEQALADMAAWVPEIFPNAQPYHDGGYRVSPADRGPGEVHELCGRPWSEHEEDLSFDPKEGIRDFAVHGDSEEDEHGNTDPKEGSRSPIDIVMEHVFEVPIEQIVTHERAIEFKQAVQWLRDRLPEEESPESQTDNQEEDQATNKRQPLLKLIPFRELMPGQERNYLVKGLIPRVGLVVVWGPPKCFKSFWIMDLTIHVALGWEYRERHVQQGSVVYCAFEGAASFGDRAEGIRKAYNIPAEEDVPFFLSPMRLNLVKDRKALIDTIKFYTIEPALVVLDTLNRSLEGSESSDEDMGAYLNAADAIRETFNCMVVIVHHCGVDGTRPRGHTSLSGAVDAQLKVVRDRDTNSATVEVEWMKDGPEGDVIESIFERVVIGRDADGDEKATLVVKPSTVAVVTPKYKQLDKDKKSQTGFRLLREAITDEGQIKNEKGLPNNIPVVPIETWRTYCYAGGLSHGDSKAAKRVAFNRVLAKLHDHHRLIRVFGDYVWIVD